MKQVFCANDLDKKQIYFISTFYVMLAEYCKNVKKSIVNSLTTEVTTSAVTSAVSCYNVIIVGSYFCSKHEQTDKS